MRLTKHFKHFAKAEHGQSMVEMALMLVILLTIMSLVLDMGRAYFSYIAIHNAAGEGALYAAINPRCPHSSPSPSGYDCSDPNNVDYRVKEESPSGLVDKTKINVTITYADGTSAYSDANIHEGEPVTVTVTYGFTMLGPYSPIVPGGVLTFTAIGAQNILDLKKN